MELGLTGKRAIVTGATKGIGLRIVKELAAEGASVALCARDADEVASTLSMLKTAGATAIGAPVNVKDAENYKKWLHDAAHELGGCDIFIPNVSAGGGMDSEKNWQRNFEIDVMGTVRGCEALMPALKKSGAGSIVIISTTAAVETFMVPQAYNAMKAALITYAKQLSQFVGGEGVRVNTVSPGPIFFEGGAWDMIKASMPDLHGKIAKEHPSGRLGTPEEVARCVAFLASPAASWVTGVNLTVDGGFTKRVQF